MFKRRCRGCNEKISRRFDFCPYCGADARKSKIQGDREDYGLLGKDDNLQGPGNFSSSPFSSLGNSAFSKLFANVAGMVEKEMRKLHELNQISQNQKSNVVPKASAKTRAHFELFINGQRVPLPNLDMQGMQKFGSDIELGNLGRGFSRKFNRAPKKRGGRTVFPAPSEKILAESAKLPRKEARTELKRLANKIVYSIEAPGIHSFERVLINQLEEGVEVKIFAKDMVLFKKIAISLPLLAYSLKNEKLFLEFQSKPL